MIVVKSNSKKFRANIPLISSKSITNRLLIIAALTDEKLIIQNESDSDDSILLRNVLSNLNSPIDVKDAGTAFRFLTAFLSLEEGEFILTGTDRMKDRPVGKLVEALRQLGAEIKYLEKENFPPLRIKGGALKGGRVLMDASQSSQFISSLLLIAPKLSGRLEIEMTGKLYSEPYIYMTIKILRYFGIDVSLKGNIITVFPSAYKPGSIVVENDWSSASFWYQAVALSDEAEIVLKNLIVDSIQGDSIIIDIMKQFNVETIKSGNDVIISRKVIAENPSSFEYDFSSCPDLVIPVAFTCAALKIRSVFSGVANLRIKETDRLMAIREELGKAGAAVELKEDSFTMHPVPVLNPKPAFNSHGDHRMVMAEAILSLVFDKISIDNHLPVTKSYATFWEHVKRIGISYVVT